jgi:hypothetical protein
MSTGARVGQRTRMWWGDGDAVIPQFHAARCSAARSGGAANIYRKPANGAGSEELVLSDSHKNRRAACLPAEKF